MCARSHRSAVQRFGGSKWTRVPTKGREAVSECRYDRETKQHLLREHKPDCNDVMCKGCLPCLRDQGNPVRHCRVRLRCTSHLGWTEYACPECVGKVRSNLSGLVETLALMPAEAEEQGVNSEAANLAGPHADYVRAQWRLVNADRAGETVEELDMGDPYTCLTMHERTVREDLGHDETTLVSDSIAGAAGYLSWVLTDLARDEEHVVTLSSLLADSGRLLAHAETARSNSTTPERGAPCPECLDEGHAPERLVRIWGHFCYDLRCRKEHFVDTLGDMWTCPRNPTHSWTHRAYENYLLERRVG